MLIQAITQERPSQSLCLQHYRPHPWVTRTSGCPSMACVPSGKWSGSHSFTQTHGKCVFPLRYTGIISEGIRAWSACANPELELQRVQAAHLGAKSSFSYALKHLPIHTTMSTWKYRPGVGYTCLTAQANRAGLHHSGRQGQSMGLCPKHRNTKVGFSPQIM